MLHAWTKIENHIEWYGIMTCNFDRDYSLSQLKSKNQLSVLSIYRTRAIITRGLYIFYPLFEGQKRFF